MIASKGFNLIDSNPDEVVGLSSGLKALTWVGEYDRTACIFEQTDAQIRTYVSEHIADPKVGIWFISDEPWQGGTPECPNAPAQHAARSALIHSIDPNAKTLIVLDGNSDHLSIDQIPAWKGSADYIGMNAYICWQGQSCQYQWIDQIGAEFAASDVPLWGVLQAFGDTDTGQTMCVITVSGGTACGVARVPTPTEIHEQFNHWRATSMLSYLVFAWRWPDSDPTLWLENHPEVQDQLKIENGIGATSTPTPTPTSTPISTPTPTPTPTGDPVIAAAGDIADDGSEDTGTANVVKALAPTTVLTLGDNAYPDGSTQDYASWYEPTWGQFKTITDPSPGNHDYHTANGSGYFTYFGGQVPGPYFSFNLGDWHMVSLNAEIDHSSTSQQVQWLKGDLLANTKPCTLAYWHEPRFTSGSVHSSDTGIGPFWDVLYASHATVVLNGHNHQYERFAKQNPNGLADANGIREFVVGTGGADLYSFGSAEPNSEVRNDTTHGVIKMTLHSGSYDWSFRPSDGSFVDSGSNSC